MRSDRNEDLPFEQMSTAPPPPPDQEPPIMGDARTAGELIASGKTLVQTRTAYQTAVAVARPRVLTEIVKRCEAEADIAGDSFYYLWEQENKKTGKKALIVGPSIELAMSVLRNFGNCALVTDVRETEDSYYFTPTFIDLETGMNFSRVRYG